MFVASLLSTSLLAGLFSANDQENAVNIGSRLELFLDPATVGTLSGEASLRLHHPIPREIVLVHDAPWEGSGTGYHTVFRDGDRYRMYYKAWQLTPQQGKLLIPHDTFGAYAESSDGIHWKKPSLGLFEFDGSKENNIVWTGKGAHDFTPFKDTNPDCRKGEEYKAIGYGPDPKGAYAFKSEDGIHWSFLSEDPVLTEGAFDTQNLAFWDEKRGEYRAYIRDFREGIRCIRTSTSTDFRTWSKPQWLVYPCSQETALYTNQIKPYHRAPHLFIGFPTRYVEREWSPSMEALPNLEHRRLRSSSSQRYGTALTEALLMSSGDGLHFHRWEEAFLRPGLGHDANWAYGDHYVAWHCVETDSAIPGAPRELSLYATESYWTGHASRLRRFTLRMDGFVSVNATMAGGDLLTTPLRFTGSRLVLNVSTSAAGSVFVEIQDLQGSPLPGFSLDECAEIYGDDLGRIVSWEGNADVSALEGLPVRLLFRMKDADLYSFQFKRGQ